ncbi:MAG: glucose-1-phosphate adenylyltransferase subunit GlgD, partial [Bacilli bacterium]
IIDMNSYQTYQGMASRSIDTWIMKKELLSKLVHDAIDRGLKSFNHDIIKQNLQKLVIVGYAFTGYFGSLSSMKSYYELNMELLNQDIRDELFNQQGYSIYTKVRDSAPTKYGMNASIKNSLIADGCLIDGNIMNSVLFRGTIVEEGVSAQNTILMQSTMIEAGSQLSYVITDKNVRIRRGTILHGTADHPIYIEKGEII